MVIPEVERTQESKIRRKDVKKRVGSVSKGGVDGCPPSDICDLAEGGVGRGFSGNEFWYLVSIIYGTWYLVL